MRLYSKLKQSENYNIIIGAIFWSGLFVCLLTVIGYIRWMIVENIPINSLTLDYFIYGSLGPCLNFITGILVCCFIFILKKRSLKIMVPIAIFMILVSIGGVGFNSFATHAAIMGLIFCFASKREDVDIVVLSKRIIMVLMVFGLLKMPFAVWLDMMYLDDTTMWDYCLSLIRYLSSMVINPEYFLAFLLYKETRTRDLNCSKVVKAALIIWFALAVSFVFNNIQSILEAKEIKAWEENNLVELEEGDWSEWTTEEDLKELEEPDWGENE